jgi:hypothetical protein
MVMGVSTNLCRDTNEEQPFEGLVCSVVDDLTAGQARVAIKHLLRLRLTWPGTNTHHQPKKKEKKKALHFITHGRQSGLEWESLGDLM